MASRADLRSLTLVFLGTKQEDKFFQADKLDLLLTTAYDKLVQEMQLTAPNYFHKKATLSADSPAARTYSLASQAAPITAFSRALAVRLNDVSGEPLAEVRDEFLESASGGCYSISGPDEDVTIETDSGVTAGVPLWMKYEYNPIFGVSPSATPEGVPNFAHSLIALDAAELGFSLGGEAAFPGRLQIIQTDMRASLMLKIGRRSMSALTTRSEQ